MLKEIHFVLSIVSNKTAVLSVKKQIIWRKRQNHFVQAMLKASLMSASTLKIKPDFYNNSFSKITYYCERVLH